MSERLKVNANKRGQEKPKQIRKSGFVPALIYNHGQTDKIQVALRDINQLFSQGVTESTLIEISIDNNTSETAFIKEYQVHPLSEAILHIDFFRVTFGEKIRTSIPIQLIGKPIGIREGGVLETFLHEIEIETFPKYLSSALEHDISELKIGDSVHTKEISIPPKSKLLVEGNPIVCQVSTSAKLESKIEDITVETEETEGEDSENEAL